MKNISERKTMRVSPLIFIKELIQKFRENQLLFLSNWLTYRVMLAFFPFLVFLMSLLGFLNLDYALMLDGIHEILPEGAYLVVNVFTAETAGLRSGALLSTSIIFILVSSVNGFRAITRCINRAYDTEDERNIFMQALFSIILMMIFTFAIVLMLLLLIFGRQLWEFLEAVVSWELGILSAILGAIVSLFVMMIVIMAIYIIACAKKLKLRNVFPGAIFTVVSWVVSSALFGYFMSNFSNVSAIYGSIAGVFILMLWLNLISVILLIGNEINAFLYKTKQVKCE